MFYQKPGQSLKRVAQICATIGYCLVVLTGVCFIGMGASEGEEWMILVGVAGIPAGCFLVWLNSLVLATFAQIAKSAQEIELLLCGDQGQTKGEVPEKKRSIICSAPAEEAVRSVGRPDVKTCSVCGKENARTSDYCINCGSRLP